MKPLGELIQQWGTKTVLLHRDLRSHMKHPAGLQGLGNYLAVAQAFPTRRAQWKFPTSGPVHQCVLEQRPLGTSRMIYEEQILFSPHCEDIYDYLLSHENKEEREWEGYKKTEKRETNLTSSRLSAVFSAAKTRPILY